MVKVGRVIHTIRGRMRINIPKLAQDEEYGKRLNNLISCLKYITSFRFNPAAAALVVTYNSEDILEEQVRREIFHCVDQALNPELVALRPLPDEKNSGQEINFWERLGMPALALGLSIGAAMGLAIPELALAGVVLASAIPAFSRALEGIVQQHQLTIDFLDSLAIGAHTLQGNYFAPSFMTSLLESGEVIRDMTARSSERASLDLLNCLGKMAWVEREGVEQRIPVEEIRVGDCVLVYPGDLIPVDGRILKGTGLVDQQTLTGESVPISCEEGQEVLASTLLIEGQLCIEVARVGHNTRAGIVVALMKSAPVHDTRVENYAALVANQAVVPTLLISGGVLALTGDWARATALITLDFGTGIRVSVPTTILSALNFAARNGVYIRSGRAIEILSRVDTVVFDKTGTLTQGSPDVTDIKVIHPSFSTQQILTLAASAEQGLSHPVAAAIVRCAQERNVPFLSCEKWEYRVGLGVTAKINNMSVLVGSNRFMKNEHISIDIVSEYFPDINLNNNSIVYVAVNEKLSGFLLYSDPPRPESADVISALHDQSVKTYMLSGDNRQIAATLAGSLGIPAENTYAEAYPERKVEVLKELHESGKTVAFVGDGINDSAALAYADVSISFAGATDIARETADVVLMNNDLRGLIEAIRISKFAVDIIWQNTAIVAVPNLGALVAGVAFTLDPILAVIINNGTAILAELNGLRPLFGPREPQQRHKIQVIEIKKHADKADTNLEVKRETLSSSGLIVPTSEKRKYTASILAKRLGVTYQSITVRRLRPDFSQWCQVQDPEGLAWRYDEQSKKFYSVARNKRMLASRNYGDQ
ncbi:heavy metal translocating P-type ATPase [Anthocerotibacter panamensis]|uniref:heavy metal translocating P-type ATPase n=1 Tax=Anthocerotibacter panamensis TaxID=2857077 RepID=UPI001C40185A|nr:heavy metal translocating P-type ATPase [Anthocerotibacter panamensis]